ncbi:MAG: peptidylprolyl isomerase [Parvularculaceae bacterium]|nr:peptidylprolyl isomerase [Parvularculaceae bacterium]
MIVRSVLLASAFALAAVAPAAAKKAKDPFASLVWYQAVKNAPDSEWRRPDPENLLLMDLPAGQVVIEMSPELAPKTVAQVKTLVRQGFYDGLKFHRVIEGAVAQGGDPKGDGQGGSSLPNIPGEFSMDTAAARDFTPIGRDRTAAQLGFLGGLQVAAQPESLRAFVADKRVQLWGVHCPGALSMARTTDPNGANSQFFLVIGDARQNLDTRYAVWGRIIDGYDFTRRINRGEPPKRPTTIMRMRIAADLPAAQRPNIEVLRTDGAAFKAFIDGAKLRREDGFVRDICDITPPRRANGEVLF